MLLDKVIEKKIALGCSDRREAMEEIRNQTRRECSFYSVAQTFRVLVNESAEDFAIEFMTAYNKEIAGVY